jgi:alpha-galactosidase
MAIRTILALLAVPVAIWAGPGDKPAAMDKPVKVYILMGQSNMLGFGTVAPEEKRGTLENLVRVQKKYPNMLAQDGSWAVRKDVRYVHVMQSKKTFRVVRNEWLTVGSDHVGPEMQIGHLLGDYHDEPVLILKACIGNRSLGWDYLPPGSESYEYRGKMHAGYRDSHFSWVKGGEDPRVDWKVASWYAGKQYDDDVRYSKAVLAEFGTYYPEAKGYEIAGFFWWQGHKDQTKVLADRYEENLVRFIKSIRKDFGVSDLPVSIATIAFNGRNIEGPGLTIVKAQLAVSGDKGKYPEFKGNVKSVDCRRYWQPARRSPGGGGHHYNGNAQTYMDVGNALGEGMLELLKGEDER